MSTIYKALQRVEQKYNLPHEVWLMIERKVYENYYKNSMDAVTDPKLHRDIARCEKNDVYNLIAGHRRHYGRYMLHMIRPTHFLKFFEPAESLVIQASNPHQTLDLVIGGARFKAESLELDPSFEPLLALCLLVGVPSPPFNIKSVTLP